MTCCSRRSPARTLSQHRTRPAPELLLLLLPPSAPAAPSPGCPRWCPVHVFVFDISNIFTFFASVFFFKKFMFSVFSCIFPCCAFYHVFVKFFDFVQCFFVLCVELFVGALASHAQHVPCSFICSASFSIILKIFFFYLFFFIFSFFFFSIFFAFFYWMCHDLFCLLVFIFYFLFFLGGDFFCFS